MYTTSKNVGALEPFQSLPIALALRFREVREELDNKASAMLLAPCGPVFSNACGYRRPTFHGIKLLRL